MPEVNEVANLKEAVRVLTEALQECRSIVRIDSDGNGEELPTLRKVNAALARVKELGL